MHRSSYLRMSWFADNYLDFSKPLRILEIGSYGVNGTYREIFFHSNISYTGLDAEAGPNVDLVPKNLYRWDELEADSFDVVVSGQAFEHIEFFWITFSEMTRVLKRNGLMCIIAPNGFGEHRYPVDCWRFFTDGMIAMARYNRLNIVHAHTNSAPSIRSHDWYSRDCADCMLVAAKPYAGNPLIVDLDSYRLAPSAHEDLSGGMIPYSQYRKSFDARIYLLRAFLKRALASTLRRFKFSQRLVNYQ